jgi:molybdopterin converting factor subunit 1
MKILYFAQAASLAGCREEEWDIDSGILLSDFWVEVLRLHPGLAELRSQCRVASGGEYVQDGELLDAHEDAAVIPPVSGG